MERSAPVDDVDELERRVADALIHRQLGALGPAAAALEDVAQRAEASHPEVAALASLFLAGLAINRGAFDEADGLLSSIDRTISPRFEHRLLMQRSALQQHSGHAAAAITTLTRALEAAPANDSSAIGLVLSNRGIARARSGDLAGAEIDLRHALAVAPKATFATATIEHNLGQLLGRRGDVREALRRLHHADEILSTHPVYGASRWIAEAEILLHARLLDDAHAAATSAAATESTLQHGEAQQLLGRIGLADLDLDAAREHFAHAGEIFESQGRENERRLVGLAVGLLDRHRALTTDLEPSVASQQLLIETCFAIGQSGRPDAATALHHAANGTGSPLASDRLAGHAARAMLALDAGDRDAAHAHLTHAFDSLRDHLRGVGSIELRAAAAHRIAPLEAIGVALARDGGADHLLGTVAQLRTLIHTPGSPPGVGSEAAPEHDPLAEGLDALRGMLADSQDSGWNDSELEALEQRIRSLARLADRPTTTSAASPPHATATELAGDDGRHHLLFSSDGTHLVRLAIGSAVRLDTLGSHEEIDAQIRRLHFSASQWARTHHERDTTALDEALADDAAALSESLLGGLAIEADHITIAGGRHLTGVPWRLLPALAGEHVELNLAFAPAVVGAVRTAAPTSVAVVAGPGLGAQVETELNEIAAHYPTATLLNGPKATVAATLEALVSCDVVHIAGHGVTHPTDPLLSAIELADGPLTTHDVDRLPRYPHVAVLAACGTGTGATGQPIDYEMAATLTARGAGHVVFSNVDLSDDYSHILMPDLHRGIVEGRPPAMVLASLGYDEADVATAARTLLVASGARSTT